MLMRKKMSRNQMIYRQACALALWLAATSFLAVSPAQSEMVSKPLSTTPMPPSQELNSPVNGNPSLKPEERFVNPVPVTPVAAPAPSAYKPPVLPRELSEQVYSKPVQVREISPSEVAGRSYYEPTKTLVTDKIDQLQSDLGSLQSKIALLSSTLNTTQRSNETRASMYYASVATINTQLQTGTTPGNPRLMKRVAQAEANLENLGASIATLNQLSLDTANTASEASFLLEATRAAYGLSGAVEEDHVRLAELEDSVNNTIVIIERILNNVNDDITRMSTYLSSERNNLRTLALAVTNGDLYGKSLSNRPFSSVAAAYGAPVASDNNGINAAPASYSPDMQPAPAPQALSGPRPLVKIRFDRPDVNYEEAVYLAMNEALQRYPNARFDLVAVHPTKGNAAEVAIESTKARRNAEKVLRTLTQMGVPLDRVDLSHTESAEAQSNEVHIYIR